MEERIDAIIAGWGLKAEKKRMFGGMTWLLGGNMACATLASGMVIVRIPEQLLVKVLNWENVYQAEMNGRIMKNWAMCDGEVLEAREFSSLLEIGKDFALSMPAK